MIPLAIPNLSGNEASYLADCVATNFVSSVGPYVARMEDAAARIGGFSYGIATSTGTSGLHVALHALGVRPDDLVVIPTFTFIATANAVSMCGATPWLFDVTDESWTLDAAQLAAELDRHTRRSPSGIQHMGSGRRVSAIVAVCTAGHPADFRAINEVASSYGLPVLIDAAAALGAEYLGLPLGASATTAVLSLNGNKTFTAGGGGVVLTQDPVLAERVRHLTTTARVGQDYDHDEAGFNYRLTNVQAAIGLAQLEQADLFLETKRRIDATYRQAWADTELVGFPSAPWGRSACWMSGALVPRRSRVTVPEFVEGLRAHGIQARPFWKPMHLQLPYGTSPRADTRTADDIWGRVLTLPCSTSLSPNDQSLVVEAVLRIQNS